MILLTHTVVVVVEPERTEVMVVFEQSMTTAGIHLEVYTE